MREAVPVPFLSPSPSPASLFPFFRLCRPRFGAASRRDGRSVLHMGRAERGVVLLLVGLAVAGHAVRRLPGHPPTGTDSSLPHLGTVGPAAQRSRALAEARPLRPGEKLDPDRATAPELARLPGVGMRMAKEIVADRELRGPFGSADALLRVDGIGPVTVRRLEPFLRFALAGTSTDKRLNLNTATQAELERLPGIGATRARAVLAYRDRSGPFADPRELERVPGIGARLAARLAPLVRVRRSRRPRRHETEPRAPPSGGKASTKGA